MGAAAFRARGGKLLMYYGWADNVSSARTGIDYYESVERAVGDPAATEKFLRLFLMPGVGHCSGGPGPDQFDAIGALELEPRLPRHAVPARGNKGLLSKLNPFKKS